MLPGTVCHKVTTPAVGELVRDDIDVFTVLVHQLASEEEEQSVKKGSFIGTNLRDNAGSRKGENRVLHSTVREAGRENQNVVLTPGVGVDNFLQIGSDLRPGTFEIVRKRISTHTSMVLMKVSVSASSSHLHSSSLSGLVATTLRGPIEASDTSLG